jgi:acetoin utilization protein AcuC
VSGPVALVYGDALMKHQLSDEHPLQPIRVKLAVELIRSTGLIEHCHLLPPRAATDGELELVHSPEYVALVRSLSDPSKRRRVSPQKIDAAGFASADNPISDALHDGTAVVAGASLVAAEAIESGAALHAFSPSGGLHHAHRERASGFCTYNDAAIACQWLKNQGHRVAYIDVDVHHGDGVQAAFYDTDQVLTISLHESGRFLFPGTGFVEEMGTGKGKGYAVNLPFPPGADDTLFLEGFTAIIPPLVEAYKPDLVVTQLGVDTFHDDPLAHGDVTTSGFVAVLRQLKALAPRWIATGGGGYNLTNVARAWTLAWSVMNSVELPDVLPEGVLPLLHQAGYEGQTLRDPEHPTSQARQNRLRVEVQAAIAYLERHVFPIHGIH